MNATDFLSSNRYFYLPTKRNPKVVLSVDSRKLSKNAFELYNPFSFKAKLLRFAAAFCFHYINGLSKNITGSKQARKSDFIAYLETLLNQPLVSSVYLATEKDKVVLQLQAADFKVVGYLKYPLNYIGGERLQNEQKAIEILSQRNVIEKYILCDEYHGDQFILLKALEGKIGQVSRQELDNLLLKFNRGMSYRLINHPRIIQLKSNLAGVGMESYAAMLESVCQSSTLEYLQVYEHGDFTPWNIMKVEGQYIPFDLEYFIEDGLEFLDLIKYYYQVGRLLKKKKEKSLISYLYKNLKIPEVKYLLQIFLIKEILLKDSNKIAYDFEVNILNVVRSS
ncbi:hypothetical protein N8865_00295 [Francisellaceae bacterium]|nr:hypothetical protein [Francisellaceae bacterium]